MKKGYIFNNEKYRLRLSIYDDGIIRVSYGKFDGFDKDSLIVVADAKNVSHKLYESNNEHYVETNLVKVIIDKVSLNICFEDINGKKLSSVSCPIMESYDIYRESGGHVENRKTVDGVKSSAIGGAKRFVRSSFHAKMVFDINDEILFGLGSHSEGYPCINGNFVPLYQENMRIAIPYFVSTNGYAYLIDNTSFMTFDCRDKNMASLYIDCADSVDYYFICGSFDEICTRYRFLTGTTPMLPKWAVGYAQSKERYETQQELIDIVENYRKRKVPLDLIIQDWQYWDEGLWGEKSFDKKRYPDMKKCTNELHNMGAHLMISIWPNMSGNSDNKAEFEKCNMLLDDGSVYNAFDENARSLYWKQADDGLFKYGIDAWWCDSSEPYDAVWFGTKRLPLKESMEKSVSEFKKYLDDSIINAYSLKHSQGIYENQRKGNQAKRGVNLTRSGYSGQHRYSTIAWSGDISASWEVLKKQVHIMQNYISCGEAYWNSDIGGFFVKSKDNWFWKGEYENGFNDEEYWELYTRWLQFAGFTPFMRSHGTDFPREIWRFGEKGTKYYDAIESAIKHRYSLVPYFYSIHAAVTFDGKMPVKPLAIAFPDDKKAQTVFNEYMYGNEFLVCPVTEYGLERMNIYLPDEIWYDYFTNKKYIGGRNITIEVNIDNIPVFVRAGSIIPTVQVMQYTDEISDAPYNINIYPGADGLFILYDDSGDGYDYEHGEYSRIQINYTDNTKKVISKQLGTDKYARKLNYHIINS